MILLGLLAALYFDGGRRAPAVTLMVVSVVFTCSADIVYYIPSLGETEAAATYAGLAWLAGYVLIGAAGLHRSAVSGTLAEQMTGDSPLRRLQFVGIAVVAMPAAYVVDFLVDGFDPTDWVVLATVNAVVAMLIVLRAAILLRYVASARRHADSAHRLFETVFESAGVGITIGANGVLQRTNGAFQQLLGYSADELAGTHVSSIVHRADLDTIIDAEIVPEGRSTFDRRYMRRDGSVVQTRATLTLSADGTYAIGVFEDVTGKAELEEQQRESQKMEAVGRLAGGIAHDFNNILTVVSGHAELLRDEVEDDARADVEVIVEAAQRAADADAPAADLQPHAARRARP